MNNSSEILTKLTALQVSLWQMASLSLSEAANDAISFDNPLQMVLPVSQLSENYAAPQLIAQFSLSSAPANPMMLLLPQETAAEFLAIVAPNSEEILEDSLDELKPILESAIRGACQAISNARNDSVIPTSFSIKFAQVAPLDTMLEYDDLIVTQVAISGESLSGTAVWVLDYEAAAQIVGMQFRSDYEETPVFEAFGGTTATASTPAGPVSPAGAAPDGLELLLDIPLEVSVELGRVRMQIREVVDLGAGSIVEIDKAAGEPVDVLVNGRLVARGEVVVIEDNFGVRITEILSPQDRMQRLNDAA